MKIAPESIKALESKRYLNVQEVFEVLQRNNGIVWSWAARSYTQVPEKALMFRVSGYKFKGNVMISLNFMDYFDVEFFSVRGVKKHEITDICGYDGLIRAIDEYVEKQPDYIY